MKAAANPTATTREQLISHAQVLIRERGYNGFSYRDLAEQVGVKTASIHYYFPSKDDLLLEALNDYAAKSMAVMRAIDESLPAKERLDRYAQRFIDSPSGQICMCGMLSADLASVPEPVRQSLQGFYRMHETWLAKVMADGVQDGTLKSSGDAQADGRWLYAAFQGALMGSRLFQNSSRLKDIVASVQT